MAGEVLVDQGGLVLERAKVVLSFCGFGWGTGSISTSDVRRAFSAVVASPYLSHLVQYRGIRRAEILGVSIEDTRNLGRLGPDPRKFVAGDIWLLSDEDIKQAARTAMKVRPPEGDERVFYLVVVSQDPIPIVVERKDDSGFHNTFEEDGRAVFYGVLLHQAASTADESWKYLPGVFTHELVEASTDPDLRSGFIVNPIGEICDTAFEPIPVRVPGFEHEITLSLYWSELVRAFVAPTSYSLRIALGKRSTDAVANVKSLIQGNSVRNFIMAGLNP
jgi:hypothetical protein